MSKNYEYDIIEKIPEMFQRVVNTLSDEELERFENWGSDLEKKGKNFVTIIGKYKSFNDCINFVRSNIKNY